ncbi:Syndetin [Geodia barretti]|uniref:Syndetin n=6 Tax=Geodia barretti TaxID=519541 RepID=A0AA35X9M6_GEOBA|nr:Syndetin [Geodia barretti]
MRQQSLNYFKNYHRARLEELKIFLETEAWEVCPVRSTFSVHQLREFRFINSAMSAKTISQEGNRSCFTQFSVDGNPFTPSDEIEEEVEEIIDHGGIEDTVSDDEHEEDNVKDDLKHAFVDEDEGKRPPLMQARVFRQRMRSSSSTRGPLLANTTLTVLRFFGHYMRMMNVLKPIAFDVLECLSQLFDYYLFGVYDFFVKDLEYLPDNTQLSSKLLTSLKRISESFIIASEEMTPMASHSTTDDQFKVTKPWVNSAVSLTDGNTLFGLSCRMVAVESLVHLAQQFENLLPYMECMIPESKMSFLRQFVSQTVQTAPELRKPAYHGIAIKALPCDQILQRMVTVKWDIRDIKSQHSSYVDSLVQEFVRYQGRLVAVEKSIKAPAEVPHMLWEGAVIAANRVFVEGFSLAKKCTNEGRALMQLDFQQYRTKVEKISGIRPLPYHQYVEDYIKAYYLSETDTEEWIRKHTEYSSKQLQSLVVTGVGSRITKRSRQRLLTVIEELEKRK